MEGGVGGDVGGGEGVGLVEDERIAVEVGQRGTRGEDEGSCCSQDGDGVIDGSGKGKECSD